MTPEKKPPSTVQQPPPPPPPTSPRMHTTLEKERQLQALDEAAITNIEQSARRDIKAIELRMSSRRLRINFLEDHPGFDAIYRDLVADGVFKELLAQE